MTRDAAFMRQAVRLGRKGLGRTSPNPPVGAVVVNDGRVVGRGWHHRAGLPHGEIEALRNAGTRARGATLYVTLEPCNHHGRTPPCTEAILAAGIRRVVYGIRDPNPRVRGAGSARLRRNGVAVVGGVEAESCAELQAGFLSLATRRRPQVTLKLAATLDGRIATRSGASRWITGEPARRMVHRLRNQTDAVMVGAGTLIADDPELTYRIGGGRDPLRIVVDGRLRLPLSARVVSGEAARGTMVVTAVRSGRKLDTLRRRGVDIVSLSPRERARERARVRGSRVQAGRRRSADVSLRRLLRHLATKDVGSVLIEGGGTLAAAALREHVVDRVLLFLAPKLIGGDGVPMIGSLGVRGMPAVPRLRITRVAKVGDDLLVEAVPAKT